MNASANENAPPRNGLAITTIAVPVDFSDGSLSAARYATMLARQARAALVFLHVIDDTPFLLVDVAGYMPAHDISAYKAESDARLAEWAERAKNEGCEVTYRVFQGPVAQGITSAAADARADLIVIGTHGRGRLGRLLLGSVAERVVRISKIPVLCVRPD